MVTMTILAAFRMHADNLYRVHVTQIAKPVDFESAGRPHCET